NLLPVVRLKNIDRKRIDLPRRTADSVAVVFDHKQHWQFPFLGKADRFEKVTLSGSGIADSGNNEIRFAIEFEAPGDSARREELGAGRGGHTPDVAFGITVVRRHLPAVALAFALREIIECQFG